MSIVLQAFRADQRTEISLIESISTCERLCFRTVLAKPPSNSVCAFQAGTLSITTPDGVAHDVTPSGGIPCLGGTNPTFCNPALMSITSPFVCYTVREQDIDNDLGLLLAMTAYKKGTSHSASNDLPGVVSGATALALGIEECPTGTDCASSICDPARSDGVRQGLCTVSNLPLSTPCEADEDPCTIDHCDGNGGCVQKDVIHCSEPTNPCDGGQRCDPASGQCINEPDAPVSTACELDDDLCTVDHCNGNGSCVRQSTVSCPGPTEFCDGGQTCDPETGRCVNAPDAPVSTPCEADSDKCTVDHCDGNGSCVQQSVVSCTPPENPCDGGQRCDPETGTCEDEPEPPASTPCNVDGDLCTVDHCDGNGTCVKQRDVTCPGPTPPCEGGQRCEPSTGKCVNEPDTPPSTPCEADTSLCTIDHCDGNGSCVQQSTVQCQAPVPPCEGGAICNPETGQCVDQPDAPLSTPCQADTSACTVDHCNGAGACVVFDTIPFEECRDHYKCYRIRPPRTPPIFVDLDDQFGRSQPTVIKPIRFCNPVDKNNEGLSDPTAHLSCYKIKEPGFRRRKVEVTNQFGTQTLVVTRPETLCVPAEKDNVPSSLLINHFKCYRVVQARHTPEFDEREVTLKDQFETKETEVNRPFLLCNPVKKNDEGTPPDPAGHLTCYKIQDAPGQPHFQPRPVEFEDQFTSEEVPTTRRTDCSSSRLVCVPSTKRELDGPGTTTTTTRPSVPSPL